MASASTTNICYCGGNQKKALNDDNTPTPISQNSQQQELYCQPCSTRHLASQIARYQAAKEKHEQQKRDCHVRLLDTRLPPTTPDSDAFFDHEPRLSSRHPLPDPNQINQQVSQLKHKLDRLRIQSNELAVRLTAKTMENDEREEQLQYTSTKVQLARDRLERMRQCLLLQHSPPPDETNTTKEEEVKLNDPVGGGLRDALVSGTQQIQTLRFHFACKVFDMHRLDVGEQYYSNGKSKKSSSSDSTKNDSNESATGVGKIGNLPLPHAGPILYGVIPHVVLASSLRWVASLTQLVARCLGVVLPHPILVCFKECHRCGSMYDFMEDVIDVYNTSGNDHISDADDEDSDEEDDGHNDLCTSCLNEGQNTVTTTRHQPTRTQTSSSSSTTQSQRRRSSLLKFVGSSARKAISLTTSATARAITHVHQQSSSSVVGSAYSSSHGHTEPSISAVQRNKNTQSATSVLSEKGVVMSGESISKRINHTSYAYLRESRDKGATEYVLNPPRWNDEGNNGSRSSSVDNVSDPNNKSGTDDLNSQETKQTSFSNREEFHVAEERFATGLQLLQNDVVALCFRAGVDVSTLWPAESVLLNLHSLWCHCQKMADV